VTLHSLRARALGVAPVRLTLGVLLLAAARIAGAANAPALLAFVVGAFGIVFVLFNDPRARFLRREVEPLDWPAEATVAPLWRQALAATLPSTVGVTALAVIACVFRPTLGALLAGVCAGLGIGALVSLTRIDPTLYVDPKSDALYRR